MDAKMKFFYPKVKAIDAENRRITVCISKDEIDRYEERIEIQAIGDALEGYAMNPVVLGDHQHRLASGQSSVIGHGPPDSYRVLPTEVDVDIVFSITDNAESYWINYRDGHQKAVSIGFIPLEWKFEETKGQKIYVLTKIELLELSCVAVGANRGALVKTKGRFDQLRDDIDMTQKNTLLEAIPDTSQQEIGELGTKFNQLKEAIGKDFNHISADLEEIKTLLTPDQDGFAPALLLGDAGDRSAPAGDSQIAELIQKLNQLLSDL